MAWGASLGRMVPQGGKPTTLALPQTSTGLNRNANPYQARPKKKCGSSRHEPTGAVLVELSSCLTQPFTATLTGFESLKVNWDFAERVELSFFCLSVLLSFDLLAAALVLAAWILSDGRRELVCRS